MSWLSFAAIYAVVGMLFGSIMAYMEGSSRPMVARGQAPLASILWLPIILVVLFIEIISFPLNIGFKLGERKLKREREAEHENLL